MRLTLLAFVLLFAVIGCRKGEAIEPTPRTQFRTYEVGSPWRVTVTEFTDGFGRSCTHTSESRGEALACGWRNP